MGQLTVGTRSIRTKGKANCVPEAFSDIQGLCTRPALWLELGGFGIRGRRLPRNPPGWFPKEWRGINSLGLTPELLRCLATNSPSTALSCLSPEAQDCLQTNLPPELLSNVLNCLVTGAQSGAVSNILSCLETNVPPDLLPKVTSCLISDVINYEHPQAREAYARHIAAVTGRYKNSRAIGG